MSRVAPTTARSTGNPSGLRSNGGKLACNQSLINGALSNMERRNSSR